MGKARRRVRQFTGRPDNSPWIIAPPGGAKSSAYVDFLFALDYLSPNAPLVKIMQEAMGAYGISFLPVNINNLQTVTRQIRTGWLQPFVYLDLCSAVDDRFFDLLKVAADQGVYVVDHPRDVEEWTWKAPSQPKLEAAGLPVPPTVIIPKGSPDRDLTPEELAKVGDSVVIKPSIGYANRGVVVGVAPTKENIAKARDFQRNDDWLIQKKITWTRYGNRPAYVRSYNIFGHRSLVWWSRENGKDKYEPLSWHDVKKYDLLPALDITDRIAALTGMDFFSSEIAITDETGPGRFVLIDYINDQCDMDPQVRPETTPVPQEWCKWVCQRVAEFVYRRKHNLSMDGAKTLALF